MCLGIPGKVLEIIPDLLGMTMGKVNFGGVAKEICLAYTPEVEVGDYVIVHAGFALNKLDEEEAEEVFALLREMGEAGEVLSRETSEVSQDLGGLEDDLGGSGLAVETA